MDTREVMDYNRQFNERIYSMLGINLGATPKKTVDQQLNENQAKENENIKQWLLKGECSARSGRRWGKRQLSGQEAELISETYQLTRTVFAFPGGHSAEDREIHVASEDETGKVVLVIDKPRP